MQSGMWIWSREGEQNLHQLFRLPTISEYLSFRWVNFYHSVYKVQTSDYFHRLDITKAIFPAHYGHFSPMNAFSKLAETLEQILPNSRRSVLSQHLMAQWNWLLWRRVGMSFPMPNWDSQIFVLPLYTFDLIKQIHFISALTGADPNYHRNNLNMLRMMPMHHSRSTTVWLICPCLLLSTKPHFQALGSHFFTVMESQLLKDTCLQPHVPRLFSTFQSQIIGRKSP